jgi:RHS repeat-associated protein
MMAQIPVTLRAVFITCALGVQFASAQDAPPIYNDRVGSPPFCEYAAAGPPCSPSTDCDECSPSYTSTGWPCDGCSSGFPTGRWPVFSAMFYQHNWIQIQGFCYSGIEFIQLPLLDLPDGFDDGGDPFLAPDYQIILRPIARLGRVREVPLECSPARSPVDAAARYSVELSGFGSGAECQGTLFFVTAEYNPTLFDVTLHGNVRSGGSYFCGSVILQPWQPQLIVNAQVSTNNDLRYPNLLANPQYVKVAIKAGRSTRDADRESVKLRVHSFNWGSDVDSFCRAFGNCPEGIQFRPNGGANVQVFTLELPENWCRDTEALSPEDALPISTLNENQRRSAEFEGAGTRLINDLTSDLPVLRSGHARFRVGATLEETLGVNAWWHTNYGCNTFVRLNVFGVWCAVDDLPGWSSQQVGSELVVTDNCEGLSYHYQRPGGGSDLGETELKLARVSRSGGTIRNYTYSGGGVGGDLMSQTDVEGNVIAYVPAPQGNDLLLTITGTAAAGGSRELEVLFGQEVSGQRYLKSATWVGGPDRQYDYIFGSGNPALDGKVDRVLDGTGNVLLDFEYDAQGRVIETTRGDGPTMQVLSRQAYLLTPGGGGFTGNTFMVNQCYVSDTEYQATVYTFDNFNRVVEIEEFHSLQTLVVDPNDPNVPAFTGTSSITTTLFRENEDLDVPGGFYTIEKRLPSGLAAEYTVFDSTFNVLRMFTSDPGLASVSGATLIRERRFTHQQFAGIWQTTSEMIVARDNATTTMQYDQSTGFLTSRTMPSISAANSGSGQLIPGQTETYDYDPVNKKLVNTPSNPGTRLDGEGNVITIRQSYDAYDYPVTLTEGGVCGARVTETEYNAFGDQIAQTDADAYVTVKVYDEPGHPNDGSGLLLGQYTYAAPGGPGPVSQQTKYSYFTAGANTGRLAEVRIADHVGPFTLGSPAGWQVTAFTYDVYGRVSTKTTTHTARPGTFVWTYAYDDQDRVRQITYPDDGLGSGERMWVRTLRNGRGLTINEFVGFGGDLSGGTGGTTLLTNTHGYDDNGNLIDRQNQTAADLPDHSEFFYDGYDRRERRVDRGGAEPDITTHYEYIANGPSESMDVVREYVEQGGGSPASDIRRDIDELGRPWKERIVKTPPTTNDNADRITTTTFDITGNEVATRVADTAFGDALVTREFTCFDYPDSMTQRLSDAPLTEAFTDYQTDGRGNVTIIDDPVGNRTQHDFDALGLRWRSRSYEGMAALQLRSETTYTSREQKATEVRYSGAGTALDQQRWEYDALGFQRRWARMADPASAAPIQVTTDRVIDTVNDGVGRVLSRADYDNGAARTTQWDYDDIGRLLTITHPVGSNTETLTHYPNSTRLETRTITDQIGSRVLRTAFEAFGRLETETWQGTLPDITTSYTYDAAGRRVTTTDPKGYVTQESYDGIGQRTQFIEDAGGADQRAVTFTYTQKGDLETVTSNDGEGPQVTSYQYDLASRRKRITHPDSSFIAFTYDDAGRIETRTTEDSFVTWYERNWRGQALEKREDGPAGTILEEFAYDPLGRMTLASVGPQATSAYKDTWTYGDGVNGPAFVDEPLSESQTVNGVTKAVAFEYSTAGERTLLEYPAGCNESLAYTRDGFGHVTAIDRSGNRLANYTYAGRFPRFRQVRTTSGNNVWIETNWTRTDQLRRPAVITNAVRTGSPDGQGGTVTESLKFTNVYDAASNLDSQTVANRPDDNGLHDFAYDRLHRLTDIDYPDATSEGWQMDDLSNWETYTARDAGVTTYADNVLNQYTAISGGVTTPLHDAKGNLVRSERGYGLTYDFENRLTRVYTDTNLDGDYDVGEPIHAEYVVDAQGRRVSATSGGTTTYRYYDGSVVLTEYPASTPNTPSACYFNGPTYLDEKLLVKRGSSESYVLLKDLYTVAGTTSASGQLSVWYGYGGYGQRTEHVLLPGDITGDACVDQADMGIVLAAYGTCEGDPFYDPAADLTGDDCVNQADLGIVLAHYGECAGRIPFGVTGQRVDEFDSGALQLYDFKARVYDPRHGRFLQRDPGEFADSHNPYEYALSRPTVATDPTGEFTIVGISVSTAISRGLSALNAADAARRVLNVARRLRAGVDVRTILIDVVIDVASDRLGGKLFDKAAAALNQVGKLVRKGFDRHHPIPIALGGNVDQFLNPLSTSVHRSNFAKALNEELEKRGIDLKATGGPGNSAKEWAELLENGGPGVQADVLESVLAASKRMDDQFGTNLTESVWLNILTGHFKAVE